MPLTSPIQGVLVDYPSLAGFDLNQLTAAVDRWSSMHTQIQQAISIWEQGVLAPLQSGGWSGAAASGAKASVLDTHAKLVATEKYLNGLVQVLTAALAGLTLARNYLDGGSGNANSLGYTLDGSSGNITSVSGAGGSWDAPAILAGMDIQLVIYQARYMAFTVGVQVDPVLEFATQFGDNDGGPWQTEADANLQTAKEVASGLPDQLQQIQKTPATPPPDTAAQPYNTDWPGPDDITFYGTLQEAGVPYFVLHGWDNAGALLQHWLDNSGDPTQVSPAAMMNDMSSFANTVQQAASGEGVADTGWNNFEPAQQGIQSEDWYYAFDDFRFRVLALTMIDPRGNASTEFTVGIKKPYVFHSDHPGVGPGPLKVPQSQFVSLHTTGLAQNFIAEGITSFAQAAGKL